MSTIVANELIPGVNIISQYESTYYPDNYGGLVFFMLFSSCAVVVLLDFLSEL